MPHKPRAKRGFFSSRATRFEDTREGTIVFRDAPIFSGVDASTFLDRHQLFSLRIFDAVTFAAVSRKSA